MQRATCFHEAERQKLLSALETGFGSFDAFNSLVSNMLKDKSVTQSAATAVVASGGYERMPDDDAGV